MVLLLHIFLAKSGKDVLLLEGGALLSGATGNTTGKLTTQHDLVYANLIKKFGEDSARVYYEVNDEAIQFGKSIAKGDELKDVESVLFARTKHGEESLRHEWRAYQQLKIPGTLGEESELPVTNPVYTYFTRAGTVTPRPFRPKFS